MSLSRATQLARRSQQITALSAGRQRRWASDSHHHDDAHGSTAFNTQEGFNGPFWRNFFLASGVLTGVFWFAPSLLPDASKEGDDAPWLTRVIAHNLPSKSLWQRVNERHLVQTEELAQNAHVVQNAKQSSVYRYRYTNGFDQVSAHRLPVGGTTDIRDLEIKNDVV